MPAQSKQQQKFMGMVHALKKGDMDPSDASPELKKAADSMSGKDAKDFASTSHKGLPKKVKQEIVKKLKEYANKMGTNTMGGDDYTSSKKGGLRDNDGYDNVDYNRNMKIAESTKAEIIKDLDKAKNDLLKKVDVLIAKKKKLYSNVDIESPMSADEKKLDKDIADLFSQLNKLVLQKRSLKEGPLPQNWMSGRVSDYHTQLRGKKKEYDNGTNFKNDNSGHPDLEDETSVTEAQAVSGGKVHKFITGKNLKFKGKSYSEIHFETLGIDNKNQTIRLKIIAPKEIFGNEMSLDFRTIRRGPFLKTNTNIKEYAQRLDFSYLADDEAILDGTPEPKDAIDRTMDEAMIRKAGDIAQKLIPKDTWSRYVSFSDTNSKNKEFVKNMIRDLSQSLNRFYKTYDINVRVQENENNNQNIDMVLGVLSILKQIEDKENRKKVAIDMIRKFKEDNIGFDYKEFLNLMGEYSMGSYEYNK